MAPKSALLTSLALVQGGIANHGYVRPVGIKARNSANAVFAEELLAGRELPMHFDWRHVDGQNYVTTDWNQHVPVYCGACWVHGTLSTLNDRIKIMRHGAFPDIMLGRQSVVNCVPELDGDGHPTDDPPPGCNGGSPTLIHNFMHKNKLPDETCMPYAGVNMGCDAGNMCRNCISTPDGGYNCWKVPNYIGYGVSSYGTVKGEDAMMKEIYARGPIVCSFATDGPFMYNFSQTAIQNEGVYRTTEIKNASQIDHNMEVAGWGVTESGVKYWVIRNSWGTYWGEAGWLKLERGINTLMSESECDWAVPTWDGLDEALHGRVWGSYKEGLEPLETVEAKAHLPRGSLSAEQAVRYMGALFAPGVGQVQSWAFATAATTEQVSRVGVACVASLVGAVVAMGALKVMRGSERRSERTEPLLG